MNIQPEMSQGCELELDETLAGISLGHLHTIVVFTAPRKEHMSRDKSRMRVRIK